MTHRILSHLLITALVSMAVVLMLAWPGSAQATDNSEGSTDLPADTTSTATTTADESVEGTAIHFSGGVGFSGDVDWIKVNLEADQMYRFALKGSSNNNGTLVTPIVALYDPAGTYINGAFDLLSGSGRNARLHYYVLTDGDYWVSARGYSDEIGTYKLRVVKVSDDTEPDNISTPGTIEVGSTVNKRINYRGDSDWFKATLFGGCTYPVSVSSNNQGLLPGVRFFDSEGDRISLFFDSGNYFSWNFAPESSGTYFLASYSRLERGGTGRYSLVLDHSLALSGMTSADYAENGTSTVATYAATGAPENSTVAWSLDGNDKGDFDISSSGALTFLSAPDYENPGDANMDNVYEVTVNAVAGSCTGTLDVTITVTDVNEGPVMMTG